MLLPFVLVCVLEVLCFGLGQTSDCSQLNLASPYIVSDDSYAIITNNLPSSTVIQVSLMRKQPGQDTSWFVMGASDSQELIGSWQPFTSDDGEMIDCSTSPFGEQIVTNKDSRLTTATRTVFPWILEVQEDDNDCRMFLPVSDGEFHLYSTLISRLPLDFCNSAPCLNGGVCVPDPQYSFCRCVPPWNGFTCNLRKSFILDTIDVDRQTRL